MSHNTQAAITIERYDFIIWAVITVQEYITLGSNHCSKTRLHYPGQQLLYKDMTTAPWAAITVKTGLCYLVHHNITTAAITIERYDCIIWAV